jgi:hypothetical protein
MLRGNMIRGSRQIKADMRPESAFCNGWTIGVRTSQRPYIDRELFDLARLGLPITQRPGLVPPGRGRATIGLERVTQT